MTLSPIPDKVGSTGRPWLLPLVAGSTLFVDVITACICIFPISLPIFPVLAICSPIAIVLLCFLIWSTIRWKRHSEDEKEEPTPPAEVDPKIVSEGTIQSDPPIPKIILPSLKETAGSDPSIPEIDLSRKEPTELFTTQNGGQVFPKFDGEFPKIKSTKGHIPEVPGTNSRSVPVDNFSAITEVEVSGSPDGKIKFNLKNSHGASENVIEAKNLAEILTKCSNVAKLTFEGSVPENLKIDSSQAEQLTSVTFRAVNFSKFKYTDHFGGSFSKIAINFEECKLLSEVTLDGVACEGNLDLKFNKCNDFEILYVGNEPYTGSASGSITLERTENGQGPKVNVVVQNCENFNYHNGDKKQIDCSTFNVVDDNAIMNSNNVVRFSKHYKKDNIAIICEREFGLKEKIPNELRSREAATVEGTIVEKNKLEPRKVVVTLRKDFDDIERIIVNPCNAEIIELVSYCPSVVIEKKDKTTIDRLVLASSKLISGNSPSRKDTSSSPSKDDADNAYSVLSPRSIYSARPEKTIGDEKIRTIQYAASEDSTIEITNFNCSLIGNQNQEIRFTQLDGEGDKNLPKIILGRKKQTIKWFINESGEMLYPVLPGNESSIPKTIHATETAAGALWGEKQCICLIPTLLN